MSYLSGGYTNILVVEDDPSTRTMLKAVLANEHHWQPTVVADGKSAVEAWAKGDFDVMLLDVKLPDMDGIEVTCRIREMERLLDREPTPIIAFSSIPDQKRRQQCIDSGINEFIAKPARMREVIASVYKHLPKTQAP